MSKAPGWYDADLGPTHTPGCLCAPCRTKNLSLVVGDAHVADFAKYDGTQSKFASERGVDVNTFRYWLRKVRDEGKGRSKTGLDVSYVPEKLDDILVAAARKNGAVTSRQVASAFGVKIDKARRWLGWLVNEGRLNRVGSTKSTRFILP